MRAQLYTSFPGIFTVACYTLRPTAATAGVFTAASVHEEFSGLADALLQEHLHIEPTCEAFPAAQRLQNYFPTAPDGTAIFCLKHLKPAGVLTDIDADHMLEITRLRYEFVMDYAGSFLAADSRVRSNKMRAISKAIKDLFAANGIPTTFIFGDTGLRPADAGSAQTASEFDVIVDFAPAGNRRGVDI